MSGDVPEEIPQRQLRNDVARVLREVAGGRRIRVTVRGRVVAEIAPAYGPSRFAPRQTVERIIDSSPLDEEFEAQVDQVLGETVEEQ